MPEQPTTLDDPTAGADDLQRQVDSLLSRLDEEPPAEGGGKPKAPEPIETPAGARIEALDQQLAALSEELLQQDGDAEPASALPGSVPDVPPGATTERQGARAQTPPHAKPSETPAASVPPSPSKPPVPPVEPATSPGPAVGAEADAEATVRSRIALTESVCTALAGAVEPVARRVSAMPRGVRDSIGWIGAMTLFYAACVWTVVLVLRGPGVEPPDGPPPEIAPAVQTTEREGEP